MPENGDRSSREQVLDGLRDSQRFVVVTHENPDGDALGSLIAMQEILTTLGKDAVMFIDAADFPLAHEYRFFPLPGLGSTLPDDVGERTSLFLDCGNLDRAPAEAVGHLGAK